MSGVSFLPYDGGTYRQAPYEEITEEQYHELVQSLPDKVDWMALALYENEDKTEGSQELACTSGECEL